MMAVCPNAKTLGFNSDHWGILNQLFQSLSILGIFSLQMLLVLAQLFQEEAA